MLVQTRRGSLVQDRFPDLVAAAEGQLPHGLVLDGELVVWAGSGALAVRGVAAPGRRPLPGGAAGLAARWPAYFAFDILQQEGSELMGYPYRQRRLRLAALFALHRLTSPWALCPMTTDLLKAQQWLESWTEIPGVEGIVVKAMNQPYRPGPRGWYKLRHP
ncbi:hypothetical protein [Streptomyces sp. NPDC059874]|uniref:ATP-dependent DNA ligase n=1 Tax=Streptomyces sp. NPDC059874 TaxID=3346983 RepID=UPI0036500C52